MESASPLEHSCHYWLMDIELSNQVVVSAETRQGLHIQLPQKLQKRTLSQRAVSNSSPTGRCQGCQQSWKGWSTCWEGHTPEHKKQSMSSDLVRSTNSPVLDNAETNIKSIQEIRVQISKIHCYISHSSSMGKDFSLDRLCRKEKGSSQ